MLKNPTLIWCAAFAASLALSSVVSADESTSQNPGNMSVSDGGGGIDNPPPGSSQSSQQQAGRMSKMSKDQKESARLELSPHSVMIQSSLQSALDHLKGLKTELQVGEAKKMEPSTEFLQHYKMFGKEINTDVSTAKAHIGELDGSISKFPQVAQSGDYKKVDSSFKDVSDLNSDFQAKVSSNAYWKNRDAVMKDLDMFEKRINKALDDTKSFNSSQLDISHIG